MFKRGGTWSGTLSPKGAGSDAAQNTLGSYGSGAKPLIDGAGAGAAIAISGQSYWTIDGFEVTNFAGGAGGNRCGIRVGGGGDGSTIRRIRILNNDVHDIQATPNVNDGARNWGGIFVWIDEPGKADDVLIEGNTCTEIQGQGISFWGEFENAGGGMNYNNCSPHVVVRGNRVWRTSGDGILMLGTDNELVEYNEVAYAGVLSGLYNNIAAAWPSRHSNGVWQYNHVHHTKWLEANDSTAFDNDGFVDGTTYFQYNYTHDNEGGFHMEYFWVWDYGKTVSRYNISVNDGRGTYARVYFSNRPGSELYNNVFYNPGMTLDVSNGGDDIHTFRNNIFVGSDLTTSFSRQGVYYYNSFSVGITPPDSSNGNLAHDPKFMSANTVGNLAGFILQATSPCRSTGQVITGNGGKDFWSAGLPVTAPHRGASQINAIGDYTTTPTYVHVSGPLSVVVPFSGGSAATFTATVHDQNFRPMAAPAVTWSLSPTVAGCSVDSSGVVTLSPAAAGQRFAVTATSGAGSHTFSFSATAPVWTNSAGTGIWNTTDANWSGQVWADGGDATFAHTAAAQTVTISGTRSAAAVKIGNRTNNANYTFTGGSLAAGNFTLQGETSTGPTVSETNLASTNLTVAAGRVDIGRGRLIASGNTTLTADTIGSSGTGGLGDWGFLRIQDNAVVTATNGLSGDTTAWGLELNGGTLITKSLWAAPFGGGQARLTFNGTLIKANADSNVENPNFITLQANGSTDSPSIEAGGAKFDTDGHAIGIGTALQGSGTLTKSGTGTLTLSATNSYSGQTNIQAGMLVAANNAALGAGGHNGATMSFISTGATLGLQGGVSINEHFHFWGDGVDGLGAVRSLSGNNSLTDSYCLRSDVAVGVDADTLTVAEFYQEGGAFGLTKKGTGMLAVSALSYTGNTTVEAGTLRLGAASLADTSTVSIAVDAKIDLAFSGSDTVAALFIDGVQQPRGIWNATRDGGHFAGSGSLVVTSGPDPVGDGVWSSPTSGDWSAVGNWHDTLLANGTDKIATFNQATGVTVTLDTTRTLGGLSFSTANTTITGSNALTLDVTSGTPQVSVGPGVTATIAAPLAGTDGLAKTGSGTLSISSESTYAGATAVDGGTLAVSVLAGASRHFDASQLTLADGAGVSAWTDLTSNAANATVPSGNATPTYLADAGTGTGLGAVNFLGNNNATDSQALKFARATDVRSVLSVFKGSSFLMTDSVDTYALHRLTDTNPADPLLKNHGQINYLGTVRVNGAAVTDPQNDAMPTSLHNGFNLIALVGNGTPFALDSFNKDRIYHSGNQAHAETILFNTVIDATRRGQIEAYLAKKWFGTGDGAGNLLPTTTAVTLSNGGVLDLSGVNHQTLASLASADTTSRVALGAAAFSIGDATDTTFVGVISGNGGSLIKSGPGALTLTGANDYTGTTQINAGTLHINGSTASSITVAANATLGGNGSVVGAVTVQTDATLAPGASIGTLTAASAAINGKLAIDVSGSSADRLSVTGNLNITNAALAIIGTLTANEYVIASYGSLTGSAFASITGLPEDYDVDYSNNQIRLIANPTFASWIEENYPTLDDKTSTGDPDNDGLENVLEYVLGGNPSLPDSGVAPTVNTSGNNLVFTFQRVDAAETSDINLIVEAGTNLTSWPETYVVSPGAPSSGVAIQENEASPDTITVTIPQGTSTAKFARLRVVVTP